MGPEYYTQAPSNRRKRIDVSYIKEGTCRFGKPNTLNHIIGVRSKR